MNRFVYRVLTRKALHTLDEERAQRSPWVYARDCFDHHDCYTTSLLGILNGIIPRVTGGRRLFLVVDVQSERIVCIGLFRP